MAFCKRQPLLHFEGLRDESRFGNANLASESSVAGIYCHGGRVRHARVSQASPGMSAKREAESAVGIGMSDLDSLSFASDRERRLPNYVMPHSDCTEESHEIVVEAFARAVHLKPLHAIGWLMVRRVEREVFCSQIRPGQRSARKATHSKRFM